MTLDEPLEVQEELISMMNIMGPMTNDWWTDVLLRLKNLPTGTSIANAGTGAGGVAGVNRRPVELMIQITYKNDNISKFTNVRFQQPATLNDFFWML